MIVKEGAPQTMIARFMYGPLDMVALTGEKVCVKVKLTSKSFWNSTCIFFKIFYPFMYLIIAFCMKIVLFFIYWNNKNLNAVSV